MLSVSWVVAPKGLFIRLPGTGETVRPQRMCRANRASEVLQAIRVKLPVNAGCRVVYHLVLALFHAPRIAETNPYKS
jgi:hypothetical protein